MTAPPIFKTVEGKTVRWKAYPQALVIFMDLGAPSQFQLNNGYVNLTYTVPTFLAKKGKWDKNWEGYNEMEPEQYCLDIRGHGSDTYHVTA